MPFRSSAAVVKIRLAAAAAGGANKMGDESVIPLHGCRWRLWMAICLRFNALQQWRRRQQRDPLSCTMASWRLSPSYTSLVPAVLVLPSIRSCHSSEIAASELTTGFRFQLVAAGLLGPQDSWLKNVAG